MAFGSNKNVTELVITGDNKSAVKAIHGTVEQLDQAERKIQRMSRGMGDSMSALTGALVNPMVMLGGAAFAAAGGFAALMLKSVQTGAELYRMSGRLGLSVEELSALQKIAEQTGISFDDLLKLYKANNKELEVMVKNVMAVGNVMSTSAARDAAIYKMEWQEITTAIEQAATGAFQLLTGAIGRLAFIMKVFGTSTGDMARGFAFLIENPDVYNTWIKNIYDTTDAQLKQNKALQDAVTNLKNVKKANDDNISGDINLTKRGAWVEKNVLPGAGMDAETLAMQNTFSLQMQMIEQRKQAIIEVTELEMWEWAMMNDMAQQTYGNMANAAGMFYELSGQKSKEWFAIQKGFSIAQAVINTYEGATKALAQGGIFGPILAASVIAFGLAQVATIAAQQPGGGAYGGGGGGSSMPSFNEPRGSVTNNNYGAANIQVNVYGYVNEDQLARQIIPAIEKAYGDGVGRRR